MKAVCIGTRGSALALRQVRWVAAELEQRLPGISIEILPITTTGDRGQDRAVAQLGVQGAFTRELDRALLDGRIDLAVHSLKDVPVRPVDGITLAAAPKREDPRDVFIGKGGERFRDLPPGSAVGTGSVRRRALLRALRPDLEPAGLRGNVDTRLRRLRESSELQGIIIAAAGVCRLGIADAVTEFLAISEWLPAPGQGALAVMTRTTDEATLRVASLLDHRATRAAVTAERALLAGLRGGCHVPVGAYAAADKAGLALDGFVADLEGVRLVRNRARGPASDAADIGKQLADTLRAQGGAEILAALDSRAED